MMNPPGNRLREWAARRCSHTTMERVINPLIADLQAEHHAAIASGRTWKVRRVLIAHYIAFAKVAASCVWEELMAPGHPSTISDRLVLLRTAGVALAVVALLTAVLEIPPLLLLLAPRFIAHRGDPRLFIYLMPQALGVAIPVGCMVGVLYGLRGTGLSRRVVAIIFTFAVVASLAEFTTMAWAIPAGNQAFRTIVLASDGYEPIKGDNELTIGELNRRIDSYRGTPMEGSSLVRRLKYTYHQRWALVGATLVLAMFGAATATRLSSRRLWPFVISPIGLFGYYVLLFLGRAAALNGTMPILAAAWLPNAAFALLSAVVAKRIYTED